MIFRHPLALLSFTLALLLSPPGSKAAASEPWIDSLLSLPTPEGLGQSPALILLDEVSNDIDASGINTRTHRFVLRLLSNKGADAASNVVSYDSKTAQIKSLKAWLIRPGGKTETRNNSAWVDICTEDSTTLANDLRMRIVNFADLAVSGDLFAVETKVASPMLTAWLRYRFSSTLPCLAERFNVSLPTGFTLAPHTWGPTPPALKTSADGRTWSWTSSQNLYLPDEAHMTSDARLRTDLIATIEAPAGAGQFRPKQLGTWSEVATWIEGLNAGRCDTSAELAAKAREISAEEPDLISKIRAVANYVQKTRYIANAEGLSKGLGYVSRKASVVFSSGFGDCKDKANLMRSMLREIGITAYTAAVNTLGREEVHEEVPGEEQFNHAICAIRVDDSVSLPSVIVSEKLGRLLIFDPTDPYTHLGDLPRSLQGTLVHVEDPCIDGLLRLPSIPPETGFLVKRKALLNVQPNGQLHLDCQIITQGQMAARLRRDLTRAQTNRDLDLLALDMLGKSMRTGTLLKRSTHDDPVQGHCLLNIEATAKDFFQTAQTSMMIAKLDVLGSSYVPLFAEKERRLSIQLPSILQEDEISFVVPAGLAVVELPRKASIEHDYGSFKLEVSQENGRVTLQRTLCYKNTKIPPADYSKLKAFLSAVVRADRCSLLLGKQEIPATGTPP